MPINTVLLTAESNAKILGLVLNLMSGFAGCRV